MAKRNFDYNYWEFKFGRRLRIRHVCVSYSKASTSDQSFPAMSIKIYILSPSYFITLTSCVAHVTNRPHAVLCFLALILRANHHVYVPFLPLCFDSNFEKRTFQTDFKLIPLTHKKNIDPSLEI